MAKSTSFDRSDMRFVRRELGKLLVNSTPEEWEAILKHIATVSKSTPAIVAGYSSGPRKRPAPDGTVTISVEKIAAMSSFAANAVLSREESDRILASYIQKIIGAGVEPFPGQITLDRKVLLKLVIDWAALMGSIAAARRPSSTTDEPINPRGGI